MVTYNNCINYISIKLIVNYKIQRMLKNVMQHQFLIRYWTPWKWSHSILRNLNTSPKCFAAVKDYYDLLEIENKEEATTNDVSKS